MEERPFKGRVDRIKMKPGFSPGRGEDQKKITK